MVAVVIQIVQILSLMVRWKLVKVQSKQVNHIYAQQQTNGGPWSSVLIINWKKNLAHEK